MKGKPSNIDIHVGQRLRARRKVLGLTQSELADAMGVKFQQVQKYETGANRVSASKLFIAAEALHVRLEYFWQGLDATFALGEAVDVDRASTRQETKLLAAFRRCSESTQRSLLDIADKAGGAA